MDLLFLQPSRFTPEIRLSTTEKILSFKGRSSPENALMFYEKVYAAIDQYMKESNTLKVKFMFEYFNTSSSKCLFEIFKKLKNYLGEGKNIVIDWIFEEDDDDMMETGEDFADIIGVDVNFVEVEDIEEIAA